MCALCAANGTETQCPTCRQLNPVAFPYDGNADLSTLWSHVTGSFQRELAMCVVGVLIFFGFVFGGGLVANVINGIITSLIGLEFDPANPLRNLSGFAANLVLSQIVGTLVNVAVQGVALVGLYRLLIDVLVGKKADLSRMFSQLHLLPQYLVMQVILLLVVTLPTLIYFGIVGAVGARLIGVDWSHLSEFRAERLANPALFGLLGGSVMIFMVAMVVLLPLSLFGLPELIVGQCGPVEALKRAWMLGEGQRLRTLGYSFVAGLVTMAGVLACVVGLLFALPVAYMLLLALFLALRRSSSLPAAIHT